MTRGMAVLHSANTVRIRPGCLPPCCLFCTCLKPIPRQARGKKNEDSVPSPRARGTFRLHCSATLIGPVVFMIDQTAAVAGRVACLGFVMACCGGRLNFTFRVSFWNIGPFRRVGWFVIFIPPPIFIGPRVRPKSLNCAAWFRSKLNLKKTCFAMAPGSVESRGALSLYISSVLEMKSAFPVVSLTISPS